MKVLGNFIIHFEFFKLLFVSERLLPSNTAHYTEGSCSRNCGRHSCAEFPDDYINSIAMELVV